MNEQFKPRIIISVIIAIIIMAGIGIILFRKHPSTVSVSKPNSFQAMYDFFPKGGEYQNCLKSGLGKDFTAAYNEGIVPASAVQFVAGCSDFKSSSQMYHESPAALQKCFQDAIGSDLDKALSNPSFIPTAEEASKIKNCPAIQEFQSKEKDLFNLAQKQQAQLVEKQFVQPSTPSFPAGIDQSDQKAVLAALKNLDTSKNYGYGGEGGIEYGLSGFNRTPQVTSSTGTSSIKLAVNGKRGPIILKEPATIDIQAWVDPAAKNLSECKLSILFSNYQRTVKVGELFSEKIDNLMYSSTQWGSAAPNYMVSLVCKDQAPNAGTWNYLSSEVSVWVFGN